MRIARFENIEAWQLPREIAQKDQLTSDEFRDVYDHAGRTRAAIRGFIKYLMAWDQPRGIRENGPRIPNR
jgi:hypothetical protein